MSCVAKVYTGVLNKRVVHFLSEKNIIAEEQNGFRSKRSSEEHVFTLSEVIKSRLIEKKDTFVSFIDMCKAFDWVDRNLLFYKLLKYNISGKIYNAIKALYSNTVSCIKLNGKLSGWFETKSGVRQGDTLSPTLFCLFINDLITEINKLQLGIRIGNTNISILAYADDIALVAENEINLQKMFDFVNEWCKKWKLSINSSKTQIVHFRRARRKVTETEFFIGNNRIDVVNSYKYLGVLLDEHLTFSSCEKILAEAAGRAFGGIISKLKQIKYTGYKTYEKLYKTCVSPIMNYNAGVWGFCNDKYGNALQLRVLRYFLGVHCKAPIPAIQGEFGWMTVKLERYIKICKLWNHITSLENHRLPKIILQYTLQKGHKGLWVGELKDKILPIAGITELKHDTPFCIHNLKVKFHDFLEDSWKKSLISKPKLRTYRKIKFDYKLENYVKSVSNKFQRSLIAQLRMGILPLAIETGRYTNVPVNQRMCFWCKDKIEDELHFVCQCKLYSQQRSKMYDSIKNTLINFDVLTEEDKFIKIVTSCSKFFYLYLDEAWKLRKMNVFETPTV